MLHGFLGCGSDWLPVIQPYLEQHSFALVDLPNHGRSDDLWLAKPGISQWQQLLQQLLTEQGIHRYVLVGYSLGGRLALAHAATNPSGLVGMLLESCHIGFGNHKRRLQRSAWQAKWQRKWLSTRARRALADWYQQAVFADLSRKQRQQQIHARWRGLRKWRTGQALTKFSVTQQANYYGVLAQAQYPVHYLVGRNDGKYAKLANNLKQAGLPIATSLIQGAGHNVHAHQPNQWQRCFALWLHTVLSQGSIHA